MALLSENCSQAVGRGSPFSWILVGGASVYTLKNTDPQKKVKLSSRMGYYYQSIFGRKFSKRSSFQLTPTFAHRNEVEPGEIRFGFNLQKIFTVKKNRNQQLYKHVCWKAFSQTKNNERLSAFSRAGFFWFDQPASFKNR